MDTSITSHTKITDLVSTDTKKPDNILTRLQHLMVAEFKLTWSTSIIYSTSTGRERQGLSLDFVKLNASNNRNHKFKQTN